jgi:hypothetical protein
MVGIVGAGAAGETVQNTNDEASGVTLGQRLCTTGFEETAKRIEDRRIRRRGKASNSQ